MKPRLLIPVTAVIFPLVFAAWGDSLEEIQKASVSINSIRATFVQKKESDLLAAPVTARGQFYFKAPRSLRWEYVTPTRSVLIVNEGKASRHVVKDGRWEREGAAGLQSIQFVLQEISLWVKGRFGDNPEFSPEILPGRVILLTPKKASMKRYVAGIELKLSNRPGVISSVTIHEGGASRTVISFTDVRLNAAIEERLFLEP